MRRHKGREKATRKSERQGRVVRSSAPLTEHQDLDACTHLTVHSHI